MSASATAAGRDAAGTPEAAGTATRRDKRRERKKERRRRARREAAARARVAVEADAPAADPEEELRLLDQEEAEAAAESERARRAFEDAERRWLEAAAARAAEKAAAAAAAAEEARAAEASAPEKSKDDHENESEEDGEWEYIEDGPAEIIWQGNEIIVKKKKVKVPKGIKEKPPIQEDKAHCPFHLKTGACRFGVRCSRVHFYPDKSSTLLMKNMYNGPGLALEQDEGLEFTDEEIEQSYEEFYEDVHTEFLKFGELANFKVCRNGSFHLRGNVYVHYKSLDSALLAYSSMNGRYFAGKQITCEFVAVTRWKASICGEYMRSRYKTCSHGVACNFIHCFRNPGGDYEWADWDNPPPRYWIRKMVALFGPAADATHDKASDTRDFERLQHSNRKRLKSSSDRYVPRRSMDEDVHTRYSSQDYSHSKQERSSHSMNYEYRQHRRGSSATDRHHGQDTKTNGRQFSTKENESQVHKHKHEERRRSDHSDGGKYDKISSRKHQSDQRGSCEPGSSDWPSDLTDTDASKGPSGGKSSSKYDDPKKSMRKSSEAHNLERRYTAHKSAGKEHSTRRGSERGTEDDYYDEKDDGRVKSRKHKDVHNYSDDRWVATYSDGDSDVDRYQRSSSEGTKFGGKGDAHSDAEAQHQRSSSRTKDDKRRRKSHSGNKRRSTTEEDTRDSDTRGLSSDSCSR
uniref:C3H1-type domain-containing protein n=1 Tax=Setaria italica TaxID=4555 RepID=K3YQI7_SETIT